MSSFATGRVGLRASRCAIDAAAYASIASADAAALLRARDGDSDRDVATSSVHASSANVAATTAHELLEQRRQLAAASNGNVQQIDDIDSAIAKCAHDARRAAGLVGGGPSMELC